MNTVWPNGVKITDEGNIFTKIKVYIFLKFRLTKHFPIYYNYLYFMNFHI